MRQGPLIVLAMLAIAIGLVVGARGWFSFLAREQDRAVTVHAQAFEATLEAERLRSSNERVARMVRTYLVTPRPEVAAEVAQARAAFDRSVERLRARAGHEGRRLLDDVSHLQAATRQAADAIMNARAAGRSPEGLEAGFDHDLAPARDALDRAVAALVKEQEEILTAARGTGPQLTQKLARSGTLALGGGLLALLGSGVGLVLLAASRQRAQAAAERQAAEARLSEAKFAGIIAIAADAIVAVDEAQTIVIFNEGAEQIFGYRKDEVVGGPLDRLIPERFHGTHRAHVARFTAGAPIARRMGERQAIFGRRKDGGEFPAEAAISKIEVNGERLMTVVLRDVTDRQRREEEQRLVAEAGSIFASSLDYDETLARVTELVARAYGGRGAQGAWCVVSLVDDDGQPVQLEVAASDPSHRELAASLGRLPPGSCCPFLREALAERRPLLVRALEPEALVARAETPEQRQVLAAIAPRALIAVPLAAGSKPIGALALLAAKGSFAAEDLALAEKLAHLAALTVENARLYRAAREATKARDDVLGIVAHDLRSPLGAMMLNLQVLEGKLAKRGAADLAEAWLSGIQAGARTMNRLIQDLLDITKMEAGRLGVHPAPCSPARLVDEAIAQATPLAGAVRLVAGSAHELPEVDADEGRVLQVFANLLGNAIKFTPEGGEIAVGATACEPGAVRFHVRDTGPGIPAEQLKHIFDRFWQADKDDRRGAGLGLSIAKAIVDRHGGRIWAESQVGAGTTFYFTLPAVGAARPALPGEPSRPVGRA